MSLQTAVLISMGIGLVGAMAMTAVVVIATVRQRSAKDRAAEHAAPTKRERYIHRIRRLLVWAWSVTAVALAAWGSAPTSSWMSAAILFLLGFAFGMTIVYVAGPPVPN